MSWSTYRLEDFLPYTAEVYQRTIERSTEYFWPYAIVMPLVLLLAVYFFLRAKARPAFVLLSFSWCFVAFAYFHLFYSELNWLGDTIAWLFAGQSLVFLAVALLAKSGRQEPPPAVLKLYLLVMLLVSVMIYPALAAYTGIPLKQIEVLGLHPSPTALLTLGALAFARPAGVRLLLTVIPALWLLYAGLELRALNLAHAPVLLIALCAGVAALVVQTVREYRRPH